MTYNSKAKCIITYSLTRFDIYSEYQMLGGSCRTATGGGGDYDKKLGTTYDNCKKSCDDLSTCVAFEFNSGEARCELHREGITTSTGGTGDVVRCYIRREGKNSWEISALKVASIAHITTVFDTY